MTWRSLWDQSVRPWLIARVEDARVITWSVVRRFPKSISAARDFSWTGFRSRLRAVQLSRVFLSAREATAEFFDPRSALWGFAWAGLLLMGLAVAIAPSPVEVTAATVSPIVLDGDAIAPPAAAPPAAVNAPDDSSATPRGANETAKPLLDQETEQGDEEVLASLRKREPTSLSLEEARLLSVLEERRLEAEATQRVAAMTRKSELSPTDRANFLRLAGGLVTYRAALLEMAKYESWQGPDMIHAALRRYHSRAPIADFARSLLLTDQIYKYASPALTVVIDAETLTACQDVRGLIERAESDGDYRAVPHLAKFTETSGCGASKREDCYPCLRQDARLEDTLRELQRRHPPF